HFLFQMAVLFQQGFNGRHKILRGVQQVFKARDDLQLLTDKMLRMAAGICSDAPDTGINRTLADGCNKSDTARSLYVRATAKFLRITLIKGDNPDMVTIFFPE